MNMKTLMISLLLALALPALADDAAPAAGKGKEAKGADAQAIDTACAGDAATAGCGDMKVGTGLLKCLGTYRKAHKDFKASEACHAAIGKAHIDRKEKKAKKGNG